MDYSKNQIDAIAFARELIDQNHNVYTVTVKTVANKVDVIAQSNLLNETTKLSLLPINTVVDSKSKAYISGDSTEHYHNASATWCDYVSFMSVFGSSLRVTELTEVGEIPNSYTTGTIKTYVNVEHERMVKIDTVMLTAIYNAIMTSVVHFDKGNDIGDNLRKRLWMFG